MTSTYFPTDYTGADKNQPLVRFTSRKMQSGTNVLELTLGPSLDSIYLPIPPEGVSTSYKQGWAEQEMNAMQAGMSSFLSKVRGAEPSVQGGMSERGRGGSSVPGGTETTDGVGAEAAMAGFGASVLDKLGVQAFTHQSAQQSVVSYSGPAYRDHTFAFQLRPRNAMDSWAIDQIINTFLLTSSPNLVGKNQIMRLYEVPAVWEIEFLPNNGLFSLAAAALTSLDVKYGGEKFATFKEGGRPTQVDISLAFKELRIQTQDDYQKMLDAASRGAREAAIST
jgi:hypothetical protein